MPCRVRVIAPVAPVYPPFLLQVNVFQRVSPGSLLYYTYASCVSVVSVGGYHERLYRVGARQRRAPAREGQDHADRQEDLPLLSGAGGASPLLTLVPFVLASRRAPILSFLY
jgi:hypothetical protein